MRIALGLILTCGALAASAAELTVTLGREDAPRRAVLRSTTDLAILGPVLETYLSAHPDTQIIYEQWGSNDLYALSVRDCAMDRAGADLVISSAVHHMVDLVNEGCAATHVSPQTQALATALRWRDQLWGVTREPAVVVYNRQLLRPEEVPRSRFDMLDLLRPAGSRFAGKVATYDIEDSGLGFLLAFADSLEATTFGGLMEAFGRSGAVATCCSAEIIDAVVAGEFLMAYNVLGSYALVRAQQDDTLGVVAPGDYTLMLSRAAMIPGSAGNREIAADLIDFLLSPAGRAGLEAQNLIVRLGAEDGGLIEVSGPLEALERPVELNPSLLVAMDQHKLRLFKERWRNSFPQQVQSEGTPDRASAGAVSSP